MGDCNEDEWLDQTLASLSYGSVQPDSFPPPAQTQQDWSYFNSDSFFAPKHTPQAYEPKTVSSASDYGFAHMNSQLGATTRAPSQREDYFAFKCFQPATKQTPPPTQTFYTMNYEAPQKKYTTPQPPAMPSQNSYFPAQGPQYTEQRPRSQFEQQPQPSYFTTPQFKQGGANFLDQFAFPDPQGPVKEICKKKATKSDPKSATRRVRPKVVEAKGAIQCAGTNLKKGTQCKNAALMEFIGPRPIYCAEHIELDPNTIYCKCTSPYGKIPGDGKGCKEIVLKEFGVCYKHFELFLASLPEENPMEVARNSLDRVQELLSRLEMEAASAKKKRHDLFHRKNKLIPKFAKMASQLNEYLSRPTTVEVTKPVPEKAPTNRGMNPLDLDLFSIPSTTSLVTAQSVNLLDAEWKNLFSEEDAQTTYSERL